MGDDASCPRSLWQNLPFLPSTLTPGFNPMQWSVPQFRGYATGPVLSATVPNLAFFSVAAACLCLLVVWRFTRCMCGVCDACCGAVPFSRSRKSLLAHEVMFDPWLRAQKIAFICFALGSIAMAATGIIMLPRSQHLTADLASRLRGASTFVESALSVSDRMLYRAQSLRPLILRLASTLSTDLNADNLRPDIQCTAALLDGAFSPQPGPSAADLRSQLLVADWALRDNVSSALAAAQRLLNATMTLPDGTTAGLGTVGSLPGLLSTMSAALSSYASALAALPSTRLPTAASGPAVTSLQTAQQALDLTGWARRLDSVTTGLQSTAAAASQSSYLRLTASLDQLRVSINSTSRELLVPLIGPLSRIDALYLGPNVTVAEQAGAQNTSNNSTLGRPCLGRLALRLGRLDDAVFSFTAPVERSAMDAVLTCWSALEQFYGGEGSGAVAGTIKASAGRVSGSIVHLAQLQAIDMAAIADGCVTVQSALSYSNGSSALPDVAPLLSYVASLRASLTALLPGAVDVATALSAYRSAPTDSNYNTLFGSSYAASTAANSTRDRAATAPPAGTDIVTARAANASSLANAALQTALVTAAGRLQQLAVWLSDGVEGPSASLGGGASALAQLNAAIQRAQRAATPSDSTSPTANTSAAAFLLPLADSVTAVGFALQRGITTVAEQLDNALGKDLSTNASSVLRAAAANTSSHATANTTSNSTTNASSSSVPASVASVTIRRKVVQRLDNATVILQGGKSKTYAQLSYGIAVGVYGLMGLSLLLLLLAAFFNFPAGLVAALALALLMATIVLLGAWAAAGGLVASRDTCAGDVNMVMQATSPSSPVWPLVRYYLQGVGVNLPTVLRAAGLGDTARLSSAAEATHTQILNPFLLPALSAPPSALNTTNSTTEYTTDGFPVQPSSLGAPQYGLGGLLVDLGGTADDMAGQLALLLQLAAKDSFLYQYGRVKSWVCCRLANELVMTWICATACGLLAWCAAAACMFVLKNLDDMPDAGVCGCSCSCYEKRRYPKPERRRRGAVGGNKHAGTADGAGAGSKPPRQALMPQAHGHGAGIGGGGAAAAAAAAAAGAANSGGAGTSTGGGITWQNSGGSQKAMSPSGEHQQEGGKCYVDAEKGGDDRGAEGRPAGRAPRQQAVVSMYVMDPAVAAVTLRYDSDRPGSSSHDDKDGSHNV